MVSVGRSLAGCVVALEPAGVHIPSELGDLALGERSAGETLWRLGF